MSSSAFRILFLCTGNSGRSVLADATLRAWGGARFEVFSAGSRPAGRVNPFALAQLALPAETWNDRTRLKESLDWIGLHG